MRLLINEIGPLGDGVHVSSEGRIYVDRAAPGDRLEIRLERDQEGILRGEVLSVLELSPQRQSPSCPHYDVCGNCTLQHIQEKFYREWKTNTAKEALEKQGVTPATWLPPVFLPGHNRRRATFATYKSGMEFVMGYYRRRSREISQIDSCEIAHPGLWSLRDTLKPLLLPLLKEATPVDIFLQKVGEEVDLMITGPMAPKFQEAVESLLLLSPVAQVSHRADESEEPRILGQRDPITARFGDLKIKLPPFAFLQPTLEGEETLARAVMAALPPKGPFADLFSGCGTFSGRMLTYGSVEAFEWNPRAVKALKQAAGGKALKVFQRDLFRDPLRPEELQRFDAVVLDPPRAGCREQTAQLAASSVGKVIFVSCNPATFARDARLLVEGGYVLKSAQMVDQFLWSHHMEIVGVLERQK